FCLPIVSVNVEAGQREARCAKWVKMLFVFFSGSMQRPSVEHASPGTSAARPVTTGSCRWPSCLPARVTGSLPPRSRGQARQQRNLQVHRNRAKSSRGAMMTTRALATKLRRLENQAKTRPGRHDAAADFPPVFLPPVEVFRVLPLDEQKRLLT